MTAPLAILATGPKRRAPPNQPATTVKRRKRVDEALAKQTDLSLG